jgi:hypothetical protein
MTFKVIRTITRPDTSVPFYHYSDNILAYIKETYDASGKRIRFNVQDTHDTLSRITTTEWLDEAAYSEFKNDPTLSETTVDVTTYNTANNITSDIITEAV